VHKEIVYLGLGSNLGDRAEHLRAGLAELQRRGLRLRAVSSFYLTEPDLRPEHRPAEPVVPGAPPHERESGHPWYVNCVAAFDEAPEPRRLLELCLEVERDEGRTREPSPAKGNGGPHPRTLDIDVLLVGERVIDEPGLRVPHPRMTQRRFVLEPLAEIQPELIHPTTGESIGGLLAALPQRERVTPLEPRSSEVC